VRLGTALPSHTRADMHLLERVLVLDDASRFTAAETLRAPFFSDLHCEEEEPVFQGRVNIDWEVPTMEHAIIKQQLLRETTHVDACEDHGHAMTPPT